MDRLDTEMVYDIPSLVPTIFHHLPHPSPAPPGIRPSFNSLSSLVISCRLFAFRIMSSTLFFSFSVNLTRYAFAPEPVDDAVPLRVEAEEGTSKVWDLMPIICGTIRDALEMKVMGLGCRREWGRDNCRIRTFDARAEGSLMVPKSSVAFARSASLTFW